MKIFSRLKKAFLEVLSSDPVTDVGEGRFFWESTLKKLRVHDGTDFISVGTGDGSGTGQKNYIPTVDATSEDATDASSYEGAAKSYHILGSLINNSPARFSSASDHFDGMEVIYKPEISAHTGMTADATYYVVNSVANTSFELATTKGGTPIVVTIPAAGNHYFVSMDVFDTGAFSGVGYGMSPTVETTDIIAGTKSLKLTAPAFGDWAGIGHGYEWDITLDDADVNILQHIQFKYLTNVVSTAQPYKISVFDVDNNKGISVDVRNVDLYDNSNTGSGYIYAEWMPTQDAKNFKVAIICAEETFSSEFIVDEVICGPGTARAQQVIEPKIAASYRTNQSQNIPDASWTQLYYEDKEYDEGSDTDNVQNAGSSWRFVAPRDGKYLINSSIRTAATSGWSSTSTCIMAIYKNGASYNQESRVLPWSSGSSVAATVHATEALNLNAGEYIEIWLYQNSGGTIGLSTTAIYNRVNVTEITNYEVTNYAMSESLTKANHRVGYGGNGGDTILNGTYNLLKFTNYIFGDVGTYNPSTGEWTSPFDGLVEVSFTVRTSISPSAYAWPVLKKNDSTTGSPSGTTTRAGARFTQEFSTFTCVIDVVKGDKLSAHLYWAGTNTSVATTIRDNHITFDRVSDYTAGTLPRFGGATPTKSGLMTTEEQSFGGLKTFNDGIATLGDVDAGSNNYKGGVVPTISDDSVGVLTPSSNIGIIMIAGRNGAYEQYNAIISYRVTSSGNYCIEMTANANVDTSTANLTGTTGVDGRVTVSARTDGTLQIENRRGSGISLMYVLFGE